MMPTIQHDSRTGILFPDAAEPKKRRRRSKPIKLTDQRQKASERLCNAVAKAVGGLNGNDDDKFRLVCLACDLFADEVPLKHIELTVDVIELIGRVRRKS